MQAQPKVLIIAEAGVNHNGSMELAKKLVDAAAAAGVDYVKFQTFKANKLVSKAAKKADYQQQNIADGDDSQYTMLKRLELDEPAHYELISYCQSKSVKFLSTAFDMESLDFLISIGIDFFKIPSGEITNYPYLKKIGSLGKPVVLSTGMANMKEIEEAISVLSNEGTSKNQITVLHCNTEYPTPMQDVNLLAMKEIEGALRVKVGYSDHTLGIEIPIAAVALGAVCIEKHFTLDKTMEGPDHKASLAPDELIAMVSAIRNIEQALSGSGKKIPSASEQKNIAVARKSIHLAKDLEIGHTLQETDLIMKRPGTGISPMDLPKILGKRLKRSLSEDAILTYEDIQ